MNDMNEESPADGESSCIFGYKVSLEESDWCYKSNFGALTLFLGIILASK